jgi:Holliday junction DNA helicase RuvA
MPLRDLNLAILLGDVNALSRAPGIGKKTAQRIALELKDKITQADVSASTGALPDASGSPAAADSVSEAVEALIALGYSSTEARTAVSRVRSEADTPEDLIRLALRAMAGM